MNKTYYNTNYKKYYNTNYKKYYNTNYKKYYNTNYKKYYTLEKIILQKITKPLKSTLGLNPQP